MYKRKAIKGFGWYWAIGIHTSKEVHDMEYATHGDGHVEPSGSSPDKVLTWSPCFCNSNLMLGTM